MKPKVKWVHRTFTGAMPPSPGFWYLHEEDRDRVAPKKNGAVTPADWVAEDLIHYAQGGKFDYSEWTEDNEWGTYYGITYEIEPEVNEFGVVSP